MPGGSGRCPSVGGSTLWRRGIVPIPHACASPSACAYFKRPQRVKLDDPRPRSSHLRQTQRDQDDPPPSERETGCQPVRLALTFPIHRLAACITCGGGRCQKLVVCGIAGGRRLGSGRGRAEIGTGAVPANPAMTPRACFLDHGWARMPEPEGWPKKGKEGKKGCWWIDPCWS